MRVRFTPSARAHFLGLIEEIARDRPLAARKFRTKVEAALRRLRTWPLSGRRIPEFPLLPHREVLVPPYRFFYRLERKTVWIVAVWHGAQLPSEPRA